MLGLSCCPNSSRCPILLVSRDRTSLIDVRSDLPPSLPIPDFGCSLLVAKISTLQLILVHLSLLILSLHFTSLHSPQRSWEEALSKSKDASASLVQDREARLTNAIRELDKMREDLREAREGAAATAAALQQEREALSASRSRTNELHKLGVDMERELTAMLQGGVALASGHCVKSKRRR